MNPNIEYSVTDQESGKELLRTCEFQAVWNMLEASGDDRGRMSVAATIDDPDMSNDGETTVRNGVEVWEDGEEAFV